MAKLEKLMQLAKEHLENDETIVAAIQGTYETKLLGNDHIRSGMLAATNKRLVFYAKKTFGYDFEYFPYSNISSFEQSKNFMGHTITFFATGNKTTMKWIKNDENLDGFLTIIKKSIGKKESQSNSSEDITEQLRKLAALRDDGILTVDEFQTKKKQMLNI